MRACLPYFTQAFRLAKGEWNRKSQKGQWRRTSNSWKLRARARAVLGHWASECWPWRTALDWGATYFHSCLLAAAECFVYRFSFDVLQGIEEAAFHRLLSTVEGGKRGWYMVCQNGNKEIKCICREREKECFQLKISMWFDILRVASALLGSAVAWQALSARVDVEANISLYHCGLSLWPTHPRTQGKYSVGLQTRLHLYLQRDTSFCTTCEECETPVEATCVSACA